MEIQTHNLPLVIGDNERSYFSFLEGVISAVDNYAYLMIIRNPHDYFFRISPSEPLLLDTIITEINRLHNLFAINVNFSKSMKSTHSISWKIPIFDK